MMANKPTFYNSQSGRDSRHGCSVPVSDCSYHKVAKTTSNQMCAVAVDDNDPLVLLCVYCLRLLLAL